MSRSVIQTEGLGKLYRRGLRNSSETLRDALTRIASSPLAAFRRAPEDTFWALRDVSLEVGEGEVLGLIGRNGAGKTTLLKILSRITRPTTGWVELRGRVRSLLEVGTGFHSELTGRENTYLSGSILGMTKREIDRKFDEIVAFAEIDKFIDTPVKHYSSGMYVRLAFAVAAHLEPEILLVDEVLAVGDINFQKKCLGKWGDVARAGRTVVLVSHQLNQIRRLCHRVVWVDGGEVRLDGTTHDALAAYELAVFSGERAKGLQRGTGTAAQFLRWEIAEPRAQRPHVLSTLGPVTINFVVELPKPLTRGDHGVALFNAERQLMWARAQHNLSLNPGVYVFSHRLPTLPLRPGAYQWQVTVWDNGEMLDSWDCLPEMTIATDSHQHHQDDWNGILNLPADFSYQAEEEISLSALPVFDDVHYDRLNPARGAVVTSLLSELGASLGLRTAIDVGCGLGYFSGVLDSLGLDVLAVDGRLQNVQEAGRRFPGIRFHQCDAQDAALRDLGKFDLVFCFGLLYHLENPLMTIRHLHAMTSKLLLIEAVIFPGDEPIMALVDEGLTEDQGLNHIAFYPTESCLVKMLYRAGFRNVYGFETQPDHSEYRAGTNSRRTRTMLAASLDPISSPALTRIAEVSTPIAPWDPKSGIPQLGRMPNLRRFLSSPKRVKYLLVGRRVRRFLDRWPEPLQLPYGMWWLAEHSALDYTLSAGAFESAETNFVQKFLRPGQMALDIGAHHGFYTLLISKLVGRSGRVISFEPSPRERKRLEAHIRLNSCSNVRVCGVALGEAASREKLYLVDGGEDWCNSLRPPAVHAKTRQIEVEVKTLDQFLAESAISAVDFMKIDVEGAEMDVLKGATKLLQSTTRPVLLVEVYDIRTEPWGYQACEIVQFLSGAGYCWFRLSHDGLPHPISVDQKKYDANLVAVPQERVQKFLESMA